MKAITTAAFPTPCEYKLYSLSEVNLENFRPYRRRQYCLLTDAMLS